MKNLILLPLAAAIAATATAAYVATPNSLTTKYASDFGYGGIMFDLTPTSDLQVTAFDVSVSSRGFQTIDVYYRVGSSFGFEEDTTAWTLLDSVQVNGRGADNPTSLPLSVTAPSFLAGQTYGIYLELQGVTASNTLLYSNGPSTSYTNLDLELVTNCAKAAGGIGATTFSPREFNGTVYYNTLDGVLPALTAVNFVGGQTGTLEFRNGTPNALAVVGYSLVGAGPTPTAYGNVDLSAPIRRLPVQQLDAAGSADFVQNLPIAASGIPVWIQAVDLNGGLTTNSLALTIQ